MIPGVVYLYAVIFTAAIGGLTLAERRRNRLFRGVRRPLSSHRCRAWPLFSQLGTTSFQLDGVVEVCDDPTVPPGTPFSLRLTRPNRRSDYLFSKVRAAVERGHALFVDVEDYVTARKARLCANGWTVVLDVAHSAGWPTCADRRAGRRPLGRLADLRPGDLRPLNRHQSRLAPFGGAGHQLK